MAAKTWLVALSLALNEDQDLSRAQRGDRLAFAGLVRTHQRAVHGLTLLS